MTEDFSQLWNETIQAWSSSESNNPAYPEISRRDKSLLHNITPLGLFDDLIKLQVDSDWSRSQIEKRLAAYIKDIFGKKLNKTLTLSLQVEEKPQTETSYTSSTAATSVPAVTSLGESSPLQSTNPPLSTEPPLTTPPTAHQASVSHPLRTQITDNQPPTEGWNSLPMNLPSNGHSSHPTPSPHNSNPVPSPPSPQIHSSQFDAPQLSAPPAPTLDSVSPLNSNYTFETFIVGESNKYAHAACYAVAEKPGRVYNPLFIWGESGLGKTHLVQAIGNHARQLQPHLRVRYVSSEEWTNDFIYAIRNDSMVEFKKEYRNLDILIVDDVQFLQGKEGTQAEFFHTFNEMHDNNKAIILTSDRPPSELETLENRLRTRFAGGLITDIKFPDLETRMAILSKKAQFENQNLDEETLEFIASRNTSSIRTLNGDLITFMAYCSIHEIPMNRESAEAALSSVGSDNSSIDISPEIILEVCSDFYGVTMSEIMGKSRTQPRAYARQVSMYLCRELTDLSSPKIGEKFGRNHATVLHAEEKVREEINQDKKTSDEIQKLIQEIKKKAQR